VRSDVLYLANYRCHVSIYTLSLSLQHIIIIIIIIIITTANKAYVM